MSMEHNENLELFRSGKQPTYEEGWHLFEKSMQFKSGLKLFDAVKTNENFFIGKQWEGVESNGLPTPTFNIIKRVVSFITATITSDNIKVTATALPSAVNSGGLEQTVSVVNDQLAFVFEMNRVPALTREFARNAAVDGDGCTFTFWDETVDTGQAKKGAMRTEILSNQRVHFGDVNDNKVQSQPWIMIESREFVRKVKRKARAEGSPDWQNIKPDEDYTGIDQVKRADGKCTVLLLLWKDEDTGEVWGYEFTQTGTVKKPWSLGIRLYPITWLNWDYVQDCYHGQAMITGLIPNQVFINKAWALSMLSIMRTAFPKYIYNKTIIKQLDNRVGSAIGVAGDPTNAIKAIDPAVISPQVSQLIELAVNETESSLGATSVALGDTRPDNTSAIIALQRAAATPSEMTKQNLYDATEDLARIYFEFMSVYYGKRIVMTPTPADVVEAMEFAGTPVPKEIPVEFDFDQLRNHPMVLKLDVGASTYYSEIAAMQTLDSLLRQGVITAVQYVERVSDDYIPKRRALLEELRQAQNMQQQMLVAQSGMAPPAAADEESAKPDIPTGGGYSALQRKINETGTTAGVL